MTKILLLDDNADDRDITAYRFVGSGMDMVCAADEDAAFAEIHKNTYDLIISDIMMPRNGVHFAKQMVKRGVKIPLIFTSAVPMMSDFEDYNGMKGYIGYIEKPVTPEKLCKLLGLETACGKPLKEILANAS